MSKISDKFKMLREYCAQRKLVRRLECELSELYDELEKTKAKITNVTELKMPWVAPKNWGRSCPCMVVQEYERDLDAFVLDFNIEYTGPRYVFKCPFYSDDEPCNFNCRYNSANAEYFVAKAAYEEKVRQYNKNSARLREIHAEKHK